MFADRDRRMLANMSEIDPRADTPPLNWSDLGVSELPTGTVTLLLADVEGSTRLWQTQPEEMTAAVARLDSTLSDLTAAHNGVRPVEQGEGDSFVVAFARASDAVACALELQRAPLAPIALRIGVHTGEVQLRDEGNYMGTTINRTARLRDLAHGGQSVLSGATEAMVVDRLPSNAWLNDLGAHRLRDLPRPERVVQLCHPDLRNDFPPLRTSNPGAAQSLPVQVTSFVGRGVHIDQVRQLVGEYRLVTLTGAGGIGKTRLAVEVATRMVAEYADGVWCVDLAPITDPDNVPVAVARVLGLPDKPGLSMTESLVGFATERQMLIVLDNCEHLLDAIAVLIDALLGACRRCTLLATSREPIGVRGELTWRVPSLSLTDDAIELFGDRARLARPDFGLNDTDLATVTEICRRLDGIPLAIELAAARVRALSLSEIVESLRDRFRLLTGGARTAVRRQQTLRASVDWSHALLTEPERILFRRLAAFMGGFDLDAAQAVGGGGDVERYQVLDLLTLLVDKSLVVAESLGGRTRYRLLETVRQYAMERLSESGEADDIRARHRDHYTTVAVLLDTPTSGRHEERLEEAETEIDNLRTAFTWSLEDLDIAAALQIAASLQPLWQGRSRIMEGLGWFDAVLADANAHRLDTLPAARARALAGRALLAGSLAVTESMDQAEQAVTIARELNDPALLVRALTACASIAAYNAELARPYLAEAIDLARALGDDQSLCQALYWQAYGSYTGEGNPIALRAAAEEARDLAETIGVGVIARASRWILAGAQWWQGDLPGAVAELRELVAEADEAHDALIHAAALLTLGHLQAYLGDAAAARLAATASVAASAELGQFIEGFAYAALAVATLAGGDLAASQDASEAAWQRLSVQRELAVVNVNPIPQIALARGDLIAARSLADEAVSAARGWHLMSALTTRARVAMAQGQPEQAERDGRRALEIAADLQAHFGAADILECLATVAIDGGRPREAARLFGAAQAIRQRTGGVRFPIYQAGHDATVSALRDSLGDNDFEATWAAGATQSTAEAIADARRDRGERKRPSSGWASLTPAELDVVRLVSAGLPNKDIAARLFVSPRTVQAHLGHVYAKLGLASRVQLATEAARHA